MGHHGKECGCGDDCKCGSGGCGHGRKFHTKEEKLAMLKEYKEALQKELKGVDEAINETSK